MKQFRLQKLNSRGITHFVLPLAAVMLLAVGGIYTVVANRANTANLTTAAAKTAKPKGVAVVYSELGRFNSVKLTVASDVAGTNSYSCGGALTSANNFSVTKKLPVPKKGVAKPIKLNCAPSGGTVHYQAYFGKDNKFDSSYTTFDVDDGYCTLVHVDGTKVRKTPLKDGKCQAIENEADLPAKVDLTMRVLPAVTPSKKNITGYVDFASSESLTRVECTGEVFITYEETSPQHIVYLKDGGGIKVPLKYVKNPKANAGKGYCVAKIPTNITNGDNGLTFKKFIQPGGTYVLTATYAGNVYFNPVSAQTGTVTLPPKK